MCPTNVYQTFRDITKNFEKQNYYVTQEINSKSDYYKWISSVVQQQKKQIPQN